MADRALQYSSSYPGYASHALHLLGDIATHNGEPDAEKGEIYYRRALAIAGRLGMRPLMAHCHLGLGKLHRQTGREEQAQPHFINATTMYREMDMSFWLDQTEVETQRLA